MIPGSSKCLLAMSLLLSSLARADDRLLSIRISSTEPNTPVVNIGMEHARGDLEILKSDVRIPWQGKVQVPANGNGAVIIIADGYWSQAVPINTRSDGELRFQLYPTGTLSGEITLVDDEDIEGPESAYLDFKMLSPDRNRESSRGGDYENALSGRVNCTIEKARVWRCAVPAGILDGRLSISDYAPEYFWSVSTDIGKVSRLGLRKLIRGLSIAGWVELPPGLPQKSKIAVEAVRHEYAVSPSAEARKRTDLLNRTTEASSRGFFQFKGMGPGSYNISAFGDGLSSISREVLIDERSKDLLLEESLILVPPAHVEIFIDPPMDPWEGAWKIEVSKQEKRSNTYSTLRSLDISLSGFAEVEAVALGEYTLQVFDSRGSSWVSREMTVSQSPEKIFLEISAIPIRGTIKIGDSACEASLIFGTRNGAVSIAVSSDDEGSFEGILPYEGEWPLEAEFGDGMGVQAVEPVTVKRKPGERFAELEIELPDTMVQGKVVEDGEPAAAVVLAIREVDGTGGSSTGKRRRDITRRTDKDGAFMVRGLSPGELKFFAYNGSKSSDWATVMLEEGRDAEVVLNLIQKVEVKGHLSHGGSPVSGARVIAFPNEGLGLEAVSAPDGYFGLNVPHYVNWLDLVILPPGAPMFFHRHLLGDETSQQVNLAAPMESIDIVVVDVINFGYLHSGGLGIKLNTLMGALAQAGRLGSSMTGSLVIQGVAPGEWSLCPGKLYGEDHCVSAVPYHGSAGRLHKDR